MAKRSGQKRDFMHVAREIVEQAVGEQMDGAPLEIDTRNQVAVSRGSKGGKKGGLVRADRLSPARRREIAQRAAQSRWAKRKPRETR